MDATKLDFIDNQFERATAFFTFMYMSNLEIKSTLCEVYRVLKNNGVFEIWDIEMLSISAIDEDIFIAQLDIKYEDKSITTGYGVQLKDEDNSRFICDLLIKSGFVIDQLVLNDNSTFYLIFRLTNTPMGLSVYFGGNSLIHYTTVDKTVSQPQYLSSRRFIACVPI